MCALLWLISVNICVVQHSSFAR